jgi:hypothetical protein
MQAPSATEFQHLAADFQIVWNDPQTDARLKKRLLRTLIREIVADVDAQGGNVLLVVHWQGGVHTELSVRKRRCGQNRTHTAPDIAEAIRQLVLVGDDEQIAGWLNKACIPTGRGNRWTRGRVASFRSKRQLPRFDRQSEESHCWLTLNKVAQELGISGATLRLAAGRGEIEAKHPLSGGPWIFHRQILTSQQAKDLVVRVHQYRNRGAAATPRQENLIFPDT